MYVNFCGMLIFSSPQPHFFVVKMLISDWIDWFVIIIGLSMLNKMVLKCYLFIMETMIHHVSELDPFAKGKTLLIGWKFETYIICSNGKTCLRNFPVILNSELNFDKIVSSLLCSVSFVPTSIQYYMDVGTTTDHL